MPYLGDLGLFFGGFILGISSVTLAFYWVILRKIPSPQTKQTPMPLPSSSDHLAESAEWFNILMRRLFVDPLIQQYHDLLVKRFSKLNLPEYLGPVRITGFTVGTAVPRIALVQVVPTASPNELKAWLDVTYFGGLSFEITTELYVNWPVEKAGVVPVSLSVELDYLGGRFYPFTTRCLFSASEKSNPVCLLGFIGDPQTEFTLSPRVGNTELKLLGKLTDYIKGRLRSFIHRDFVLPHGICFRLPLKSFPEIDFAGRKMEICRARTARKLGWDVPLFEGSPGEIWASLTRPKPESLLQRVITPLAEEPRQRRKKERSKKADPTPAGEPEKPEKSPLDAIERFFRLGHVEKRKDDKKVLEKKDPSEKDEERVVRPPERRSDLRRRGLTTPPLESKPLFSLEQPVRLAPVHPPTPEPAPVTWRPAAVRATRSHSLSLGSRSLADSGEVPLVEAASAVAASETEFLAPAAWTEAAVQRSKGDAPDRGKSEAAEKARAEAVAAAQQAKAETDRPAAAQVAKAEAEAEQKARKAKVETEAVAEKAKAAAEVQKIEAEKAKDAQKAAETTTALRVKAAQEGAAAHKAEVDRAALQAREAEAATQRIRTEKAAEEERRETERAKVAQDQAKAEETTRAWKDEVEADAAEAEAEAALRAKVHLLPEASGPEASRAEIQAGLAPQHRKSVPALLLVGPNLTEPIAYAGDLEGSEEIAKSAPAKLVLIEDYHALPSAAPARPRQSHVPSKDVDSIFGAPEPSRRPRQDRHGTSLPATPAVLVGPGSAPVVIPSVATASFTSTPASRSLPPTSPTSKDDEEVDELFANPFGEKAAKPQKPKARSTPSDDIFGF